MSRQANGGDYVVVSGGHMNLPQSFGQDLSHHEAIQRIRELMITNSSLQGTIFYGNFDGL